MGRKTVGTCHIGSLACLFCVPPVLLGHVVQLSWLGLHRLPCCDGELKVAHGHGAVLQPGQPPWAAQRGREGHRQWSHEWRRPLIPFLHKVAFAVASAQRLRVGSLCQGQAMTFSTWLGSSPTFGRPGQDSTVPLHTHRHTHTHRQAGAHARRHARAHACRQARRHARTQARKHIMFIFLWLPLCQHARIQGWRRGAIYMCQAMLFGLAHCVMMEVRVNDDVSV